MQLGVRDAALLLNVPEKTIYRWLKEGKLPAYKVNERYLINRAELLERATAEKVPFSAEIFSPPPANGVSGPGLREALRAGGVHYGVGGEDKTAVLRAVLERMPLSGEIDRRFLLEVLLARESLGSTGMGKGIAIPHVRNPIVMPLPHPVITLCFLQHPIEFGAVDGQPVHTLFTLISPTIRTHLQVLSKLAFALGQPAFTEAISRRNSPEEIMEEAATVDRSLSPPAAKTERGAR
jgi:nitrogen PTS system EIIA component